MVRNLTVRLDDKTAKEMGKYPEVNWSEVARKAVKKYIANREAQKRYDAAVKAHVTRGTHRKKTMDE